MKKKQQPSDSIKLPNVHPENLSQSNALESLNSQAPYNFLIGSAGTGKTLLATTFAIRRFVKGEYRKIVITRPAVSVEEEHGFLPGPQPLHCKILTPTGWTTMGEIQEGDKVIAYDGTYCNVTGVFPQGNQDVYKITTASGSVTYATDSHLWSGIIENTNTEITTLPTMEIKRLLDSDKKFYLPSNNIVEFENSRIPNIDVGLFVNFMVHGLDVLIDNEEYSYEEIDKLINYLNENDIDAYDLSTFHIPDDIVYSDISNRISFIHCLQYNANKSAKNTKFNLHSQNKDLVKQVNEIAMSCGLKTHYNLEKNHNKIASTLNIFMDGKETSFQDYIADITYVGYEETKCIKIDHPDHLYITDDYIVTHNTLEEKMHPWMLPIIDIFKEFMDSETIQECIAEGLIEIAPLAYMRGRTLGPIITNNDDHDQRGTIVIADEMQNSTVSQMKMCLTRLGKNSKMIITGDPSQHDRGMDNNGLKDIINKFKGQDLKNVTLNFFDDSDIQRSDSIEEILRFYPESGL